MPFWRPHIVLARVRLIEGTVLAKTLEIEAWLDVGHKDINFPVCLLTENNHHPQHHKKVE